MQPQYIPINPRFKDITGQRFGRLIVLYCTGHTPEGRLLWLCRCDCGNERTAKGKDLLRGHTLSCGCLYIETRGIGQRTHGKAKSRIYKIWQAIKNRCTNPETGDYRYYGGRGITICQRWLDSFDAFYADMGEPPTSKHTVDRIDNYLGYSPQNCRWATRLEQGRNIRKAMRITIDGKTLTTAEWAEIAGISSMAIIKRIRKGIPPKVAVFHPAQPGKPITTLQCLAIKVIQ